MEIIFDEEGLRTDRVAAIKDEVATIRGFIQLSSPGRAVDDFIDQIEKLKEDADGRKFIEVLRAKLITLGEFMSADSVKYRDLGKKEEVYVFIKGRKMLSMKVKGDGPKNEWLGLKTVEQC